MLLCLAYTARGEEIEKDTAKIRNVELNEVVVQSFKQQRDLRLEPLSASAVTGTAIQNRNITGIKEFSSFIPNLFMPDYEICMVDVALFLLPASSSTVQVILYFPTLFLIFPLYLIFRFSFFVRLSLIINNFFILILSSIV